MAILSTRQAQRLGRPGGKVSAANRKGNSEWGRRAQLRWPGGLSCPGVRRCEGVGDRGVRHLGMAPCLPLRAAPRLRAP